MSSKRSPFDQDADGVGHELVGHLQDLVWQRGADETHLSGRRQVSVHVIDLFLKTCRNKTQSRESWNQHSPVHTHDLMHPEAFYDTLPLLSISSASSNTSILMARVLKLLLRIISDRRPHFIILEITQKIHAH